ncbi:MAG: SprT-like domain-containing protein [Flavobacteriaceae bacterium]
MTYNDFIPIAAQEKVRDLLNHEPVLVKVVKKRRTKHGDFRKLPSGKIQITVNESENPFRFLITLLHEMAHHIAFQNHGFRIAPHGREWKNAFSSIAQPFLVPSIFPSPLLEVLHHHLKNPKASSDTDAQLGLALKSFDPSTHKKAIFELPAMAKFRLDNGRVFQKGLKQRKRYLCTELSSGKAYLFQPTAEVDQIEE